MCSALGGLQHVAEAASQGEGVGNLGRLPWSLLLMIRSERQRAAPGLWLIELRRVCLRQHFACRYVAHLAAAQPKPSEQSEQGLEAEASCVSSHSWPQNARGRRNGLEAR